LIPIRFNTYEDVVQYLDRIPKFSQSGIRAANFSLDHMEQFCRLMGNPEQKLQAIHVAGTNGKGTTCQMLASVYEQAGYQTGLYTSPHLLEFNERVRINAVPVPDSEILAFFQQYEKALNEVPLSYFEISTCLAFWYFAKEQCDLAVIETGLGGRLDATNVIEPLVSIITSVSKDHTDILGHTLAEIAREKAGIIKQGRPVVTGRLPDEAMESVKAAAKKQGSEVHSSLLCSPRWESGKIIVTDPQSGSLLKIKGTGRKKIDSVNTAMALTAISLLKKRFAVTNSEFVEGIEHLEERYPEHAHFQKLSKEYNWFFDGAHNPEAIETLMDQINALRGEKEPVFVLSLMKDKAIPEMLENFQPYKNVYYIDTGTERCADCNQILSFIPQAKCFKFDNPGAKRILDGLKSELVIFAGSFYFYQQVKNWMASQLPSDHTIDFNIL
jgi:dihydrofolate synthase / folylpolyglutamate synthase